MILTFDLFVAHTSSLTCLFKFLLVAIPQTSRFPKSDEQSPVELPASGVCKTEGRQARAFADPLFGSRRLSTCQLTGTVESPHSGLSARVARFAARKFAC